MGLRQVPDDSAKHAAPSRLRTGEPGSEPAQLAHPATHGVAGRATLIAHGDLGTSLDAIAKAVGCSRATIYQYFQSKDEIFLELFQQCEPEVLEHGRRLGRLGPDAEGMRNLHNWLLDWADLYDKHAVVLLEFPGIGTIEALPEANAGAVSDKYTDMITGKLRNAGVRGMDPADLSPALLRIAHMVNLFRFRGMFGLTSSARTSASLAIAMQLLLFPDTPAEVTAEVSVGPGNPTPIPPIPGPRKRVEPGALSPGDPPAVLPIRHDILTAASALFSERGYYSVAMEDIAAAAMISRATLYRHFNSKVTLLAELTDTAVLAGRQLSGELGDLADVSDLHRWLVRFVWWERAYGGISRTWYDGTIAQRLRVDAVNEGVGVFYRAAEALLTRTPLRDGMDVSVAAAVFLAGLGRLCELAKSRHPEYSDDDTAAMMFTVLGRALWVDAGKVTQ